VLYLKQSKEQWKQEALQLREEVSLLHSEARKRETLHEEEKEKKRQKKL